MIGRIAASPWMTLVRHFFRACFRPTFLDDAGEESFKRAMIGVLSGLVALGLLLARLYSHKYAGLFARPTADAFHAMLPADQLFMIVVPMFVVGLVMALVAHAMFPDETDFRVLMPLPISRRVVFTAKIVALGLFASMFSLAANLATGVPFTMIASGRWAEHGFPARLAAQMAAGLLACGFVAAFVVACEGLIVLLAPRTWLRRLTVVTQTTLICALVLSIPIVLRLPGLWRVLQERPRWLLFLPPGWFLGAEQWLLGSRDPYFAHLAAAAVLGTAGVAAIGACCYFTLYRRFDTVSLSSGGAGSWWSVRLSWPWRRHPAYDAVQFFTSATCGRSGLHQLVVFGAIAAGLALAMNSIVLSIHSQDRWLARAALGAPLTAVIASVIGLRAAMLLPTNLRAAWIFKMTEDSLARAAQLNAVSRTLVVRGVVLPLLLMSPVQAGILGPRRCLAALAVSLLLGWVLVGVVTIEWRRIPFTCTVLFGKQSAAYTVLMAFMAFGVFGFLGTSVLVAAVAGPLPFAVASGAVVLVGSCVRLYRRQTWGRLPLEFEDYLPETVYTLTGW